jgi:hypothetical protein
VSAGGVIRSDFGDYLRSHFFELFGEIALCWLYFHVNLRWWGSCLTFHFIFNIPLLVVAVLAVTTWHFRTGEHLTNITSVTISDFAVRTLFVGSSALAISRIQILSLAQ